jgi:hypothetical protein
MCKIDFAYQRENYTTKPIVTQAEVTLADGTVLVGQAVCHELDNPVKEVGRKLALARAIASLPYLERKEVWNQYFLRFAR